MSLCFSQLNLLSSLLIATSLPLSSSDVHLSYLGTSTLLSPECPQHLRHITAWIFRYEQLMVAPPHHSLESPWPGKCAHCCPIKRGVCAMVLETGRLSCCFDCATLGKSTYLFTSQFSHLSGEDDYHTHIKLS